MMIKITTGLIDEIAEKSRAAARRRQNYCFHKEDADTLQRMINVIQPDSYTRPHRHIGKREAFLILSGRLAAVEFNANGEVIDAAVLDESGENKGVEVLSGTWHTFVSLEEDSCVYELKDGPYVKETDKEFANWAPEENSPEGQQYLKALKTKLNINK